jgi:nitric oxide dioxygenase
VPGQVSSYLHDQLQVGEEIDLLPPAGDFYLDVSPDTPVVLLSGGVGLTPMLSMFNMPGTVWPSGTGALPARL